MRKTVVRSFSIPPKLLKELERTAEEESRTYSELVREAIRQYLRNKHIDEIQMESLMRGRPTRRSSNNDQSAARRRRVAARPRRARG